jgi:hypothetical protein
MPGPSEKDPNIEAYLNKTFKIDRAASIKQGYCISPPVGCGGSADAFKDATSGREYTISGLCQKCQDRIFG